MNNFKLYLTTKIMSLIPETRGFGIKRRLLKWCGAHVGHNVRICSSARIIGCGQLSIGDNTWVGHQVLLVCSASIRIGANVNIAPRVIIGNGTHRITPQSDSIAGPGESYPVIIGDGCWICTNANILCGSEIGEMSIVGAGAVYKAKSTVPHIVWGGIPAKVLKNV